MINPQLLELPMSRTNFHGPADVRAIEVRLYMSKGNNSEMDMSKGNNKHGTNCFLLNGGSLKGKNLLPEGSKFFPLSAAPVFYRFHITGSQLSSPFVNCKKIFMCVHSA